MSVCTENVSKSGLGGSEGRKGEDTEVNEH